MNLISGGVLQPADGVRRRRRLRSNEHALGEHWLTGSGFAALALRTAILAVAGGVLLGVAWWLLAPTPAVHVSQGAYYLDGGGSEIEIGQDGWLAVLMGVAGLLVATVQSVRAREPQAPRSVLASAALLLAGAVAWKVGQWIGPSALPDAASVGGAHLNVPLTLHTAAVLVVGPLLFAVTRCLGALFSAPVR